MKASHEIMQNQGKFNILKSYTQINQINGKV